MKLKKKVKKILKLLVACSLIAYLSFAIKWAKEQDTEAVCKGVDVEIINANDSTIFITPTGIKSELKALKLDPTGKKLSSINTQKIESELNKLDYVEDVQCVIDHNSKLKIETKQILPVMRLFQNGKSFYINKDGKTMKADARYHINVPIVKGNFNDSFKPASLMPLLEYIAKSEVLSTYVTMIEANDKNNIFIIPNIDGHIVNLGNVENIESKFAKIKLIYGEVLPTKGWYAYDTISVKWDYQIVATKRNKTVITKMEYDAKDDMPDADIETMQTNSPPITAENYNPKSSSKNAVEKPKIEPKKETTKPKEETKKKKSNSSKASKVTKDAFKKKESTKN